MWQKNFIKKSLKLGKCLLKTTRNSKINKEINKIMKFKIFKGLHEKLLSP